MILAGPDALIKAIEKGDEPRVRTLFAAADPQSLITPGALETACEKGHCDIVALLVENGAVTEGRLPELLAATVKRGNLETYAYLLSLMGEGIADVLFHQKDSPVSLVMLADAYLLHKLFLPAHWQGKEAQGLALYRKIQKALPETYTPHLHAIDMTAFHPGHLWTKNITTANPTKLPHAPTR